MIKLVFVLFAIIIGCSLYMKGYSDGVLSATKDFAQADLHEVETIKKSAKVKKDLDLISHKLIKKVTPEIQENYGSATKPEVVDIDMVENVDYGLDFQNDDIFYEEKDQARSIASEAEEEK